MGRIGRPRHARLDLGVLVRAFTPDASDAEIEAALADALAGAVLERVPPERFEGLAVVVSRRVVRSRG